MGLKRNGKTADRSWLDLGLLKPKLAKALWTLAHVKQAVKMAYGYIGCAEYDAVRWGNIPGAVLRVRLSECYPYKTNWAGNFSSAVASTSYLRGSARLMNVRNEELTSHMAKRGVLHNPSRNKSFLLNDKKVNSHAAALALVSCGHTR